MKCQNFHLFKIIFILFLYAFSTLSVAANRNDLYKIGLKAYKDKNYVVSLKNLYAFYVLNETEINNKPEFKKMLNERISTSEAILKLSFASNPSIIKKDNKLRILTRKGGGTFTGTGMEIDDLLNKNKIDLNAIQNFNHKALTR
jgi:hypothetical protein